MFRLEKAIEEWRSQMMTAGVKAPALLDELESHLRDEMERQACSGLYLEQAFAAAVHLIGPAEDLNQEFQKLMATREAWQRKCAGVIYALILVVYCGMATHGLLKHAIEFNLRLLGFAAIATTVLSVFVAWRLVPRFFPVITSKKVKSAVGIIGVTSGLFGLLAFVYLILPRLELNQGELMVALLWAFSPMMSTPLILLGLDKTVTKSSAMAKA